MPRKPIQIDRDKLSAEVRKLGNEYDFFMSDDAIVAGGCSTTTFTEYRGQGILQGKGGTVRNVEGIDFWENGEPDRKYRILGVIDDSRADNDFVPGKDRAIAKMARERGGDAVILASRDRELAGVDDYGRTYYRRIKKMVVVKYVESAQNHWSERGRATSVANADALGRPRRSVLSLATRLSA